MILSKEHWLQTVFPPNQNRKSQWVQVFGEEINTLRTGFECLEREDRQVSMGNLTWTWTPEKKLMVLEDGISYRNKIPETNSGTLKRVVCNRNLAPFQGSIFWLLQMLVW